MWRISNAHLEKILTPLQEKFELYFEKIGKLFVNIEYCQHETRKYYWWTNVGKVTRKFIKESNLATPTQKPGQGDDVFKNEPIKICGTQPLKTLKWYGLLEQTISVQIF